MNSRLLILKPWNIVTSNSSSYESGYFQKVTWYFLFCFDLFIIKLNCKKLFRNIFLLIDYLSRQVLVQSHQQIFLIVVMNTLKMSNHDTGIASFEVILKFLLFRSYSELECFFIFIFELNLKFFENLSWLLDIYAGFQVM